MRHSHSSQTCGHTVRIAIGSVGLSLALLATGCGVDDRTLLTSATGANGTSGASSTPSPLSDGGGAGSDQGPQPLPRCFYLGASVEPGCETLVKNPGFGSNAASWVAEPQGITEGWLDVDAKDDPHSGSLVVRNLNYKEDVEAKDGTNGGGARQCVPITAGLTYDLAADIYIPMGQGAGFEGQYVSVATMSVFYYEGVECSGRTVSNFTGTSVDTTDEWVHVEGSTTAPKESLSMAVRLATYKPFRQIMFEAHFDNVFVRERGTP